MRSIRTLLHQRPTATLLTLAVVFAGWQCPARAQGFMPNAAQKTQQTPTGRIVWQHVGRVFVNPNTGQFVYVGYLVHIDPVDGSLFNGSPSESTAYFTFSTDLAQLTPLPNNNDAVLDLVSAGTFSVYYNTTPGADWSDPASFSTRKTDCHLSQEREPLPNGRDGRTSQRVRDTDVEFQFRIRWPDLQLQSHCPERNYLRAVSQRRATRRNRRLFCDVFRRGLCVCGRYSGAAVIAVTEFGLIPDGFSMGPNRPRFRESHRLHVLYRLAKYGWSTPHFGAMMCLIRVFPNLLCSSVCADAHNSFGFRIDHHGLGAYTSPQWRDRCASSRKEHENAS